MELTMTWQCPHPTTLRQDHSVLAAIERLGRSNDDITERHVSVLSALTSDLT